MRDRVRCRIGSGKRPARHNVSLNRDGRGCPRWQVDGRIEPTLGDIGTWGGDARARARWLLDAGRPLIARHQLSLFRATYQVAIPSAPFVIIHLLSGYRVPLSIQTHRRQEQHALYNEI